MPSQGFGQWIVIDHPAANGGGTTVFGHMWNAHALGLRQGDWVHAGQHIAFVANGQSTGTANRPHAGRDMDINDQLHDFLGERQ